MEEEYHEAGDEGWSDAEEEEGEIIDNRQLALEKKASTNGIDIRIYEIYEVYDRVLQLAQSVEEQLSLPPDEVIIILRHYGWNKIKMEE